MSEIQVDPNEITAENAGKDWLALKAAALSLKIETRKDQQSLWFLSRLSAALTVMLVIVTLLCQPTVFFYSVVVTASIIIALALFVMGATFWPRRRR